jgi:hypothetical protein
MICRRRTSFFCNKSLSRQKVFSTSFCRFPSFQPLKTSGIRARIVFPVVFGIVFKRECVNEQMM